MESGGGDEAAAATTTAASHKLLRHDSLDMESAKVGGQHEHGGKVLSWAVILQLAFQSIGVAYGDIGMSPLYMYRSTFLKGIDIIGVLSLFYYSVTLLPILKYVFIVINANDNDNGGTFVTMLATALVIGDGILTPCISVRSIQISIFCVVYPAVMIAYSGQASYLRQHPEHYDQAFFKAIPSPLYLHVFVVAVLATIIASQAMISGTFSIIQQSLSLGCFPRVTVVHTSAKYEVQVYIPEVNYFLMIACECVTLGFRTTEKIGNAYGITVVFAECITSTFVVLVMILIWKNILLIITYIVVIMSVELTYLSSVLYTLEVEVLERACSAGVVHPMGETEVIARNGSSLVKKIMIDYGYNFLRNNLRQTDKMLDVPRKSLLKVGMTNEL